MKPVRDKVVIRFLDGRLMKGYIEDFSSENAHVAFMESRKKKIHRIPVEELKAIFFVKTFGGDKTYNEKKVFGISKNRGKKIFVRFRDSESLVGYIEEEMPWRMGFFLSRPDEKKTGFSVYPVDTGSNNIKIYVIKSAVADITRVG